MVVAIFLEARRYGTALATLHRVAGLSHRSSGVEFLAARDRAGVPHSRGRFPEATIQALRNRGHAVTVGGPWSEGRLSACAREPSLRSMILRAGANPRGMQGYAIAR